MPADWPSAADKHVTPEKNGARSTPGRASWRGSTPRANNSGARGHPQRFKNRVGGFETGGWGCVRCAFAHHSPLRGAVSTGRGAAESAWELPDSSLCAAQSRAPVWAQSERRSTHPSGRKKAATSSHRNVGPTKISADLATHASVPETRHDSGHPNDSLSLLVAGRPNFSHRGARMPRYDLRCVP